jgi:hypothetical protein
MIESIKRLLRGFSIFMFLQKKSSELFLKKIPKYDNNINIDVCPGPFDFDDSTPMEIKQYFINNTTPLCHRTSYILPEPYHTNMVQRSIHKNNYPGPLWSDYRNNINKSYDCGPLYNSPLNEYVSGFNNDNNNKINSCTMIKCTDDTPFCNPLGFGAWNNEQCFCPFGGTKDMSGPGCYVQPRFNWIIGACQGSNCNGAYDIKSLQKYKNMGSQLLINYIASYNYDTFDKKWKLDTESSFNIDGKLLPYDAMKGLNKNNSWLNVQVGGSVQWGWGFHPIGVSGLGPLADTKSTPGLIGKGGGIMYVLSTELSYNFAFYMLNQATLDRGPGSPACDYNNNLYNNCWASGNAGEIDFLEPAFAAENATIDDYSRFYLNNINQYGRSFPSTKGSLNGGWGSDWETSAMMTGTNPFTRPKPLIYVAIVDKIGVWVYRIPIDNNNRTVWNGINRKNIDTILDRIPVTPPIDFQPCGNDKNDYCLMFIPNCEGVNAKDAKSKDCAYTDGQGFCNNWFQLLENTYQWQYTGENKWNTVPSNNYVSDFGVKLSWDVNMKPYKCKIAYDNKC